MRSIVRFCLVFITVSFMISALAAEEYTLDQTLERLLGASTRGQIIKGQFEVSRAKFNAEKIGYYLPEISLNSTLPSISEAERNTWIGPIDDPIFAKTRNSTRNTSVQMSQKVITGGDISISGNYRWNERKTPTGFFYGDSTYVVPSLNRIEGNNLRLNFSQPIFNTSNTRAAYTSARDNLKQAEVQWRVDQADLKKEGVTAYVDLLIADLDKQIAEKNSQQATIKAHWDSLMFDDGVKTEEEWVESKSDRLEKRLAMFDTEAAYEEKLNDFKHLLDLPSDQAVTLSTPETPEMPTANKMQWLKANAEYSSETELARMKMMIAERTLKETRSSGGLNGQLNLSYEWGDEESYFHKELQVDTARFVYETNSNNPTTDWQVSLEFSYPLWDGGASKANVRSSELAYESARLEYQAAERNAKNKMEIAIKRMEINYSKLQLLEDELELADKKLSDAKDKFEEGLISESDLLENEVYYLEAGKSRLTTLKDYYHDLIELEKTDTP